MLEKTLVRVCRQKSSSYLFIHLMLKHFNIVPKRVRICFLIFFSDNFSFLFLYFYFNKSFKSPKKLCRQNTNTLRNNAGMTYHITIIYNSKLINLQTKIYHFHPSQNDAGFGENLHFDFDRKCFFHGLNELDCFWFISIMLFDIQCYCFSCGIGLLTSSDKMLLPPGLNSIYNS